VELQVYQESASSAAWTQGILDDDGPPRRLRQPQDAAAEPVKPVRRSTRIQKQTKFCGRS
ncbi:MAG: hypothetical protein GY696_09885, partial [Gammaproteobacteria bacterium]|nr:hypothetical protein [Gammaproteobacteria bacterium]